MYSNRLFKTSTAAESRQINTLNQIPGIGIITFTFKPTSFQMKLYSDYYIFIATLYLMIRCESKLYCTEEDYVRLYLL